MSSALPRSVLITTQLSATTCLGLGLSLILLPHPTLSNPLTHTIASLFSLTPPPTTLTTSLAQSTVLAGIGFAALGSVMALSLYHRYDDIIYLSVPVGLGVVVVGDLIWFLAPELMSPWLLDAMICDFFVSGFIGWKLGCWTGARPLAATAAIVGGK